MKKNCHCDCTVTVEYHKLQRSQEDLDYKTFCMQRTYLTHQAIKPTGLGGFGVHTFATFRN